MGKHGQRYSDFRRVDLNLLTSEKIDQPLRNDMTIPAETPISVQLTTLARALRRIHKNLIDRETQRFGPVGSPLEHLNLVTNHPHFAWLQKLSGLMVELDEALDQKEPLTEEFASSFRYAIERLIGPLPASDDAFRSRYLDLLHESPEITIAHGDVRRALNDLPLRK